MHIASIGQRRNAYKLLIGKPEGKRPLQGPRHRQDGNIKVDCMTMWSGFIWLRIEINGEQGDEVFHKMEGIFLLAY